MIKCTFVINPIRPDYIKNCILSLYKYTDMSDKKVVVVDQTKYGVFLNELWIEVNEKIHMYLRPHRNLGFSKSHNEGIIHGLRWGSEYIACLNDDIEFMDDRWWNGIVETFKTDEKIMAVNPMSPREPGWGYGWEHGKYIDLISYKPEFTKEDYDYLLTGDFTSVQGLPDSFPRHKTGVIDGIATWGTVFKKEFFQKFGLFEERYYPGGGEDYDMDARCYREGYRMVGTTRSWVWHWWGSSKDKEADYQGESLPIEDRFRWADRDYLWPPEKNGGQVMDPWGKWTDSQGKKHPMYRLPEIGIVEI